MFGIPPERAAGAAFRSSSPMRRNDRAYAHLASGTSRRGWVSTDATAESTRRGNSRPWLPHLWQDRRVRHTLITRWGRALDPDDVLPEYPRPQLVRDSYLSLNGWWDYAITPATAPPVTSYDGRILVPFSPEASLSQVGRQLQPDER